MGKKEHILCLALWVVKLLCNRLNLFCFKVSSRVSVNTESGNRTSWFTGYHLISGSHSFSLFFLFYSTGEMVWRNRISCEKQPCCPNNNKIGLGSLSYFIILPVLKLCYFLKLFYYVKMSGFQAGTSFVFEGDGREVWLAFLFCFVFWGFKT